MLAACDAVGPDTPTTAADGALPTAEASALEASALAVSNFFEAEGSALAAARRATARYHSVDRALADGWGVDPFPGDPNEAISPCVATDQFGGMGHHYINFSLLDGTLDPAAPEILLYEPTRNGRLHLVAVEYVVPFGAQPRAADGGTAPTLFGRTLHESDGANGWALHVWIWRHNPAGMFADFNPNVSCDA